MCERERLYTRLREIDMILVDEKYDPDFDLVQYKTNPQYARFSLKVDPQLVRLSEERADIEATITRYTHLMAQCHTIVSESGSEGPVENEIKVHENLSDVMGDPVDVNVSGNSIVPQSMHHHLSIDDFFRRPISLDSFAVAVDGSVNSAYKVWDLLTLKPTIRAKLRNYAYFKADLHVRVAISGSPFHFGKLLISYQPFPGCNQTLISHLQNVGFNANLRPLLLSYLSQAPGACTIDYNGNRPVDIVCPFISVKPMHRLNNGATAVLSGATSFADMANCGTLFLYSLNPLKAASASPSSISVHLYAWFESVELGPPTATQIEITTEAGDERVRGPVERTSTMMANIADVLSVVPGIGVLAKASSLVFQGIAGISSWFGWSRPHIVKQPIFVKNRPYASASNTIGSETVEKIAFDPLQELSVDPRICATDKDEMTFAHICAVQSYLTQFSWTTASTLMSDPIWMCRVTPNLTSFVNVGGVYFTQPTAMQFCALPFDYWRGTIKYRFEIVCSKFHRGKIAFIYEPNIAQGALISAALSLNKNYMKIIDIQETQDVEFCVNYAQPYGWLQTGGDDAVTQYGTTVDFGNYPDCNGLFMVTPFTSLQSPDGSAVTFNVYVSGEDMQFNFLTDAEMPVERVILTEAGDEGVSPEIGYTCFELNPKELSSDMSCQHFFGEQPLSFRSCLKRYTTLRSTVTAIDTTAHSKVKEYYNIMPLANPGYGDAAITQPTLIGYLMYAFLGVKGGVRYRARVVVDGDVGPYQSSTIATLRGITNSNTEPATVFQTGLARCELEGSAIFMANTNAGIEFELPFYSPNLFHFAFSDTFVGDLNINGQMFTFWVRQFELTTDSKVISTSMHTVLDFATAEDFSLLRFQGAPYYTHN